MSNTAITRSAGARTGDHAEDQGNPCRAHRWQPVRHRPDHRAGACARSAKGHVFCDSRGACECLATHWYGFVAGLWVVEDASQAHGAKYKGRQMGVTGDIGVRTRHCARARRKSQRESIASRPTRGTLDRQVWSCCQDKIITTGGEGGLVTTNKVETYRKMWEYKDHGKSFSGKTAASRGGRTIATLCTEMIFVALRRRV